MSGGTGGFSSFAWSPGAAQNSVHEVILAALLQAQGSALATDIDNYTYAECYARARVLADLWSAVQGLKNQENPNTMTYFLPEWENIFNIIPAPGSTLVERRATVAFRFANFGKSPTIQVVSDLLSTILGEVFVEIVYGSDTIPDGYYAGQPGIIGSVPQQLAGQANIPGGFDFTNTVGDPTASTPGNPRSFNQQNWNSTMAYLLILVQQPVWMSNTQFLSTVALIDGAMEDLLPSWTTFAWGENNIYGEGGFILDTQNLDGGNYFQP